MRQADENKRKANGILRMFGIGNPFREKLVEYAYAAG
jgi:hypothetical protein